MSTNTIYGVSLAHADNSGKFHYVYRITNLVENKHYYGSRTSTVHPHKDLGVRYFSSASKEFKQDQKSNPQNYIYKIIQCYSTRKEAIQMEMALQTRFQVQTNPSFYNKSIQTSTGFNTTGMVVVVDKDGRSQIVPVDHPDFLSGGLVGINKGFKSIYNPVTGETAKIRDSAMLPEGWEFGSGLIKCYCPETLVNYHFKCTDKIPSHLVLGVAVEDKHGRVLIRFEDKSGKVLHRMQVKPNLVESYLKEGWSLGWEHNPTLGKKWIHRIENKRVAEQKKVHLDQLEFYIDRGWIVGRGETPTVGLKWIHQKDTDGGIANRKRVKPDQLEFYIDQGWIVGSCRLG